MSAQIDPRRATDAVTEPKYHYRRHLSAFELLPAVGAAVGAAAVVFYLTKLFLERTPLDANPRVGGKPRLTLHHSSTSGIVRSVGQR
jgi:hypothetical protein